MAWYKPWRVDDTAERNAKRQAVSDAAAFELSLHRDRLSREATEGTRLLRSRTRAGAFGRTGLRPSGTILTGLLGLLGAASQARTLGGPA